MDRPDFAIRQLDYYVKLKSPHPIYIADSSRDSKNVEKLESYLSKINGELKIFYKAHHFGPGADCIGYLAEMVQEKYVTFIGDDDYQIPDSLTKCAEFLENNPDYSSASGLSVSIRIKDNSVYGELIRTADYPRRQMEGETASERFLNICNDFYITNFSVGRTSQIKNLLSKVHLIKDLSLNGETMQAFLTIINGKSKVLDCLSLIRQIHNHHYELPDSYDWIFSKEWSESATASSDIIAKELALKDGLGLDEAKKITKKNLWLFIMNRLRKDYKDKYIKENFSSISSSKNMIKKFKFNLGKKIPIIKSAYLNLGIKKSPLHYSVTQSDSKYYRDFKPVMDSFSGKIKR